MKTMKRLLVMLLLILSVLSVPAQAAATKARRERRSADTVLRDVIDGSFVSKYGYANRRAWFARHAPTRRAKSTLFPQAEQERFTN